MAESYDVINLSDLPVLDAIVVPDASVIFGARLARLRELDPEFDAWWNPTRLTNRAK